jgi:LysR family hydrogen peroxide-inducible transcriptional activator
VIPSLAPYLLPKILPLLQRQFLELRLELRESQTRQLVADIASGALDAALLALPAGHSDLDALPLFDDPFLLAVPADDPRPETAVVGVEQIDQSKLILLEDGHCLRDQALAFCATARNRGIAAGGAGTTSFGASSLTTVIQMVAAGYGITLIPQIAADVEQRDSRVKFLQLRRPQPGRSIGLVFRKTSPRQADFDALADVVREGVGAAPAAIAAASAAARCMLDDISPVTVLCSSTAAAVEVTYSLTF